MKFRKLFEATQIGQMKLKNRIVMPAMDTAFSTEEGYINERIKDYYEERARGGVGLVIPETFSVNLAQSKVSSRFLSLDDNKFILGASEVVEVVHRHGIKIACQISHLGPINNPALNGYQPVAASAIFRPDEASAPPRELSIEEIHDVVDHHAKAAGRAKKAGFDAVEIHAGHRYLLNSFLSPAWNKRHDEYGGSLKNRARFLLEVIRAVRDTVGESFPVWCRINGYEYGVEGGITIEMAQQTARMIENAGMAAVHVTAFPASPLNVQSGCYAHLAAAIKEVVNIPVIAVGRITPELGERILRKNKAALIAIGRSLIADPELPNKTASGRLKDITPCIECNNCRSDRRACSVNAAWGKERRYRIERVDKAKRILVVGGGAAGVEAARVAALRGHEVVLYDKESRLGGKLLLGGLIVDRLENLREYLTTQIQKAGVKIELGKEVTPAIVEDLKPDAVIVATGGLSVSPPIRGIDYDHVLTAADFAAMMSGHFKLGRPTGWLSWRRIAWYLGSILLRSSLGPAVANWVMRFWIPFAKSVVVVGGSLAGFEVADFLVKKGRKVTIVETQDRMEGDEWLMPELVKDFMKRLTEKGVAMLTGVKYEEITRKGLVIIDNEGKKQTIEAGNIVFANGTAATTSPNIELIEALKGRVAEIYSVGDCTGVVGILQGTLDASKVARLL